MTLINLRYSILISIMLGICLVQCKYNSEEAEPENASPIEAYGLDGRELHRISDSPESYNLKLENLSRAEKAFEEDPYQLDHIIWLGRRLAYLYRYNEAVRVFSEGMDKFPESPELYRHRGHRYITLRKFSEAAKDFETAERLALDREIEIEPDGIPNKMNIPLSNLHFNIYYHWGLALYLMGNYEGAIEKYQECLKYSPNDDLRVATWDWLYMSFRKTDQTQEAANLLTTMPDSLNIIENDSYHKRISMYKGILQPEDLLDLDNSEESDQINVVTQGYGVGNWYEYNGQKEMAEKIYQRILENQYWPAFGYIAAEVELHSMH